MFIVDAFLDRVEIRQKEERRAGPLSARDVATQLLAFLYGRRAALIDPLREIFDMYALRGFQGIFDANEWHGNFTSVDLANDLGDGEMRKIVPAHEVDRDDYAKGLSY